MELKPFQIEDWLNLHEQKIRWHLSESCAHPFTVQQFLDCCHEPADQLLSCHLGYDDIIGSEQLRTEIAGLYEHISKDSIAVAVGISNANVMAMMEFLKPGMKMLTPTPTYDHFTNFAESIGVHVYPFEFDDRKPFDLDSFLDQMKGMDAVGIVNPNNPTGYTFSREEITKIKYQAEQCGCLLIVDEAYRFMTLDEHTSFAQDSDRVIVTGGLSKAIGLPGLRVGWIISSKKNIDLINSRRNYHIIALSPLQDRLACIALAHTDVLQKRTESVIQANTAYLHGWLKDNPMFSISLSHGSLHLLHAPFNSAAFSEYLYQKYQLLLAPGECFNESNCWRLSLSIDPEVLKQGLQIISEESKTWKE